MFRQLSVLPPVKEEEEFRNVTWKLSTYATIIHPIPTTHNHVNANGSTFCFLASLNKSIICKRPTVQTLNNDRIKNRIKYTPAVIRTALLFQTSGSVLSILIIRLTLEK